jgi:hypothetical protein
MVGGITAGPFPLFLIPSETVVLPTEGPVQIAPDENASVIIKSGNSPGPRRTLPEGNIGPPGGILLAPRCCASDADGGRARATTTITVSNVPDRVITQPLAGSCALRSQRAPGFCVLSLARLGIRHRYLWSCLERADDGFCLSRLRRRHRHGKRQHGKSWRRISGAALIASGPCPNPPPLRVSPPELPDSCS